MFKEIAEALDEAYHIRDIWGWLREYQAHNASRGGLTGAEPVRSVCSLDVPELASLDAKHKLVLKIDAAIARAYQGIANTSEIAIVMVDNQVFGAKPIRSSGT